MIRVELRCATKVNFDDKSTLEQVMAWCCRATSHYLSQCSQSSWCHMASLGLNELTCGHFFRHLSNSLKVTDVLFCHHDIIPLTLNEIIWQVFMSGNKCLECSSFHIWYAGQLIGRSYSIVTCFGHCECLCAKFVETSKYRSQLLSTRVAVTLVAESCNSWPHYEQNQSFIFFVWDTLTNEACFFLGKINKWGLDKMADILQMTFWNAFSWMEITKVSLKFVPRHPIDKSHYQFR